MIVIYGAHVYLQDLFSFSQNFDFPGCQGGKRAKNDPK